MKREIIIIALLSLFSGCITITKIYPIVKRDTVYVEKPILGYWPHDRGIDPGFWYNPYPSIPSGPFYPFYTPWPVIDTFKIKSGNQLMLFGDTTLSIRYTGGTDSLKINK